MDGVAKALLGRVSLTVDNAASGRLELDLDGWPLLLVDLQAPAVRVNDLRNSGIYARSVDVPSDGSTLEVRIGAVGDELHVLVGEHVAVFVVPDAMRPTHADVRMVESATGRLLLDHSVRYRQLPGRPQVSRGAHRTRR